VVAEDEAAAFELVAACRTLGELAIDAPRAAAGWVAWLERAGFTIERPFVRMRRGACGAPGVPKRQFAIAGPEFG
jgi:hypothetical protein